MTGRLGFTRYRSAAGSLSSLSPEGFLAPNGVAFASKRHRAGVLPTMLREIRETRLMVRGLPTGAGDVVP